MRGLSIILVLLNHLGFGFFKGGYVGVDVFFVISGYVITRSIRDHYGDSDFLSAFYERRIRRLLPSLVITILVCCGMAQMFFDASDRLTINSSILPSAFGFSNFFFYKQAGYFDETSIEKPLLHTWSLSVEEQFYITYALLIFLLHKPVFKSRSKPAGVLRFILLLSASASLLLSACVTGKHGSFSYFLIPTRFWEIGLGCLAYWYDWRLPARCSRIMPLLGLFSIFTGCVFFNGETPYPGIAAILPTAGTLFLILGQQNEGSAINGILSCRVLTFMGDISYALYLVHWPVIVFATAFLPGGLSLFTKIAIGCLSVFAASMLTFQIESPIRKKLFFGSRKSLFSCAAGGIGMVAIIFFFTMHFTLKPVHKMSAFVGDSVLKTILPNSAGGGWLSYGSVDPSLVETVGAGKNANTVVWGDSHAMNLFDGLVANSTNSGLSFKFFVDYATPPVLGLSSENIGSEMYNSNALKYIIGHREITNVILTANWTAYLDGAKYFGHHSGDRPTFNYLGKPVKKDSAYKLFGQQLDATMFALADANKNVFICMPVPTYEVNVAKAVHLLQMTGRNPNSTLGYSLNDYTNINANLIKTFVKMSGEHPKTEIVPLQLFLSTNGTSIVAEGTNSLYSDAHHLSSYGSIFIGRQVSEIVAGH